MKTSFGGHARIVTGLWRPRFNGGVALAIMAALLLAGCTTSQPVAYQPVQQPYLWHSGPGGYYVHSPYGNDRYVAPSPYAQPAQAAPPPTYIPNVIPRAEAAEPYTPASVATPYTPAPAVQPDPSPTPLRAVDAPGERPVDSSCGWWRLCNFWGSGQ